MENPYFFLDNTGEHPSREIKVYEAFAETQINTSELRIFNI